jgi:hypothetical protein
MDGVINKNVGKHCCILSVMDGVISKNVGKHCYILSVMDGVINKNVGKHCCILSVMDGVISKNVWKHCLLFLVYINDLPSIAGTNSKIVLFADDTSTIITCSNQEELKTTLSNPF